LERLTALEGKLSPVNVKQGLTPQQNRAHQLPALLKPKKISVLGSPKDPKHPFDGYAVGANESEQPLRNALEEAMQEVEEDMLSRVKRDLTTYLDRLDDKHSDDGQRDKETPELDQLTRQEKIDRSLLQKAVDAIDRRQAEEDIVENDYDLTEPETVHAVQDKMDTMATQPQKPVSVMEIGSGKVFEVHQLGEDHYEIRHGNRALPTKFRSSDEADIAMKLFQARHRQQQQNSNADYIEER
jgi:hypothetical protein